MDRRERLIQAGLALHSELSLEAVLQRLVFGVSPSDPATFAGVAVALVVVALAACLVPGYRASKVDPLQVLRTN